VCIVAEQQMPYFVRDGETDKRRHVGFCRIREPGHAVCVNGRERSGASGGVNQRVA
jgi:hypothetical protein